MRDRVSEEEKEEEEEEEEEERKHEDTERKQAGAASQGIYKAALCHKKGMMTEMTFRMSRKSRGGLSDKANKKRGGDQGASACKTAPWLQRQRNQVRQL